MQTCVGWPVVTQPRKGRQRLRFKPKTSTHPVSMDELIASIDSATGHLGGEREGSRARTGNYNDGCDPEHLVEFVTVSSDFYPELRAYYAEEAKEWPARLEG